jgi:diguanylate cyclase (GGDEF)-like protein
MNQDRLTALPQVLFEIGKAIGSDDNLGTLLGRISELVCELVGAEACSIMLLDTAHERLLGKASYGLARRDVSLISFRVGEGVAGWVAETGQTALINDVSQDPRFKSLPDSQSRIRSLACVPLGYRVQRIGVLTITSSRVAAFRKEDVDLLAFIATTMALDIDNARLRRLSVTDPLTEAYNREFLQQQLPQSIEQAERRGEPLAVAMIDVDHFKDVNDRLGHEVGDRVLAEVAHRLRAAIRSDDLLVRYGGEEFLVLLPGSDADKAAEVAERMRSKMEDDPIEIDGTLVEVRISLGVAQYRPAMDSPGQLVKRADVALYAAKGRGRNRVEIAP